MKEILISNAMRERSVTNSGNPYRLLQLFAKAARGETITVASIGGSITQRYNASVEERCFAALLAQWFRDTFPQATVRYHNAGIGATGSLMAVHRLERDLLAYQPDFVAVEFSVNDGDSEQARETYDNLIYNLLNSDTKPAVLCIGMVRGDGTSTQDKHVSVARHYGVPYISCRDVVWPEMEAGRLTWEDFSDDNIHPHDAGHRLTAQLVTDFLATLLTKDAADYSDSPCDTPLVSNRYRQATIYYVDEIAPLSAGCFAKEWVDLNKIPYGWVAHENGEPIRFELKNCHRVYLLFERTNRGTGGKAVAKILDSEIEMDADFKDGWGIYYNNTLVYDTDEAQDLVLTVTPMLQEGQHFALAGIMVS